MRYKRFGSKFTMYSSVPNRRAVQNKRAGGKVLKKNFKRAGPTRCEGEKNLENQ